MNDQNALEVVDRIKNRLNHSNHALVITTIKTISLMLQHVSSKSEIKRIQDLFNPPLTSMMNSEYEVQFIALKTLHLLLLDNE